MKITKELREHLLNREFYNLFDIAMAMCDYFEWKHNDMRDIPDKIWKLAEKYVKRKKMYLEDEERTYKRNNNSCH